MGFCASCGTQVTGTSVYCPACAKASAQAVSPTTSSGTGALLRSLNESLAGVLCYMPIGPIGAILSAAFLFVEPYRRNRFVRFHALQSLLLALFCGALVLALLAVSSLFEGALAPLALLLLVVFPLLGLGITITTIVLMIKANDGEMFRLPLLGEIAARRANAI